MHPYIKGLTRFKGLLNKHANKISSSNNNNNSKKKKAKKIPLRGFSLRRYAVTRYAVTRFTNNLILAVFALQSRWRQKPWICVTLLEL